MTVLSAIIGTIFIFVMLSIFMFVMVGAFGGFNNGEDSDGCGCILGLAAFMAIGALIHALLK